jgi:hypothetical protein
MNDIEKKTFECVAKETRKSLISPASEVQTGFFLKKDRNSIGKPISESKAREMIKKTLAVLESD